MDLKSEFILCLQGKSMDHVWFSAVASALALILSVYFAVQRRALKRERRSAPEAAGGWPFIGHLNLLSPEDRAHLRLSDLADKYGPVFSIRLGVHRCLVVSSWEVVKEIFTTNDRVFSNRPQTAAIQHMCHDFAMFGFSEYGSYWRELRKISTLKLLSNSKVTTLESVWESEIRAMTKSLHDSFQNSSSRVLPLEIEKFFEDVTMNTMVRIIAGSIDRKLEHGDSERWRREIKEFFKMMGALTLSDVNPRLKWLDHFFGTMREMKKTGEAMDSLMQAWLEQHKKLKQETSDKEPDFEEDFMYEMLQVGESLSQHFPRYDADTIIKSTCQAMMLGGTNTTTVTLTRTLYILLNNRQILEKAQEELDKKVGRSRKLEVSDIEKLVYIKSIIMEILRFHPPALLLPPRQSSRDCTIGGYDVEAGTRVIVNIWKIHRDSSVWSDPLEFKPERFISESRDVDARGQHFQLLPFGVGRRICPGITFSIRFMELALATLLHEFEINATPLQVLLCPRLSPDLYS